MHKVKLKWDVYKVHIIFNSTNSLNKRQSCVRYKIIMAVTRNRKKRYLVKLIFGDSIFRTKVLVYALEYETLKMSCAEGTFLWPYNYTCKCSFLHLLHANTTTKVIWLKCKIEKRRYLKNSRISELTFYMGGIVMVWHLQKYKSPFSTVPLD